MLGVTVDLGHIDWIALGAIATFLLALGTVWLGWQTRTSVSELREARCGVAPSPSLAESRRRLRRQRRRGRDQPPPAAYECWARAGPLAVVRRDDDER